MEKYGQNDVNKGKNEDYFNNNLEEYGSNVSEIDTYQKIRSKLDQVITGTNSLLDIGNGGVFDYNTQVIKEITAIDLFLDKINIDAYPNNIIFKKGSALDIPEPEGKFDTVLMVMLLHHIVGDSVKINHANLTRCLEECYRVLKTGGNLVIVESCVPLAFYKLQSLVYPVSKKIVEKSLSHPMAFQYTADIIGKKLYNLSNNVTIEEIPLGKFVLQFGFKVPSVITPVKPWIFTAKKI